MGPAETWSVTPVHTSGRRPMLTGVDLAGPGIDDNVHELFTDLAESIWKQDVLAEAWTDYVITVGNRLAAKKNGAYDDDPGLFDEAVVEAWDRLVPDLPASVRLPLPWARLVAGLLDEAAGRVGIEGRAA